MPTRHTLYPKIEPVERGLLDVGDGQHLYWEVSGNPNGKPAVALHGGPGGGSTPGLRRYFDPTAYRIVVFDQRGTGRSSPHASEYDADLASNTTAHLLADLEALRRHLGIGRWLVWGYSWGVTLALAYAERFPSSVSELVLGAVTMTRSSEIDWLYRGAGRFLPAAWSQFREALPETDRDGDLIAGYYRLLGHRDVAVREAAARAWCAWEDALVSLEPGYRPDARYQDPRYRMSFARIVTHYFHHRAWLDDGILLREAGQLRRIRGVMVQGRFDLSAPPMTAWELARAWPEAELNFVDAGHGGGETMTSALVEATDRFRA